MRQIVIHRSVTPSTQVEIHVNPGGRTVESALVERLLHEAQKARGSALFVDLDVKVYVLLPQKSWVVDANCDISALADEVIAEANK